MLQANISSKYPVFTVSGLDSNKLLKIIIYAINVKGRSDSVLLEAFTLKAAEKQMGKLSFSSTVPSLCSVWSSLPFYPMTPPPQMYLFNRIARGYKRVRSTHIFWNWKSHLILFPTTIYHSHSLSVIFFNSRSLFLNHSFQVNMKHLTVQRCSHLAFWWVC